MLQPESESQAEKGQQQLSSPGICVVLYCCPRNWETYEFNFFYLVDPIIISDNEYPDIKPTIRFKASKSDSPKAAFCTLNSTLYMFEGGRHIYNEYEEDRIFEGTFAGKFETTPEILAGSDYELDRKGLDIIKPMHYRKISPIALPTPDGKSILVFSPKFNYGNPDRYDDTFELYNVAHNSWMILPRMPLESSRGGPDMFLTSAYGFETGSRFVIRSEDVKYVLNLQAMCWEPPSSMRSHFMDPRPRGYLLGIDGFYFTPSKAYDVTELWEFQYDPCPLSKFPAVDPYYDVSGGDDDGDRDYKRKIPPLALALLGRECDGVYDLGVARAKRPPRSEWPSKSYKLRLILDMFRVDIEKFRRDKYSIYKRDMEKYEEKEEEKLKARRRRIIDEEEISIPPVSPLLNTTVTKTIKLMIDFDFDTYYTGKMYLFSI